ncbi:MAG: hypothetical protein OEY18_12550 [Candidatus Aminicenantes bacterium]|nr:hypothetical protein [Candidatus Aminicenantes bacterium]MDH5744193.1 hypothetical protein [Candidatus Aminicenantes bacterium]
MHGREKAPKISLKEFTFLPRIINPVKIKHAVFFSADEQVRNAEKAFEENMPWIDIKVFSNPVSVSNYLPNQASIFIFDDTAINIVDTQKIRQFNKDAVLILLSSNEFIQCSPPSAAEKRFPFVAKADLVFAYNTTDCAPNNIIASAARAAEDLLNITQYSKARRFIFLIVDDEPRWFSQFLPVLYNIIGQRADVMLARTFEESLRFIFGVEREAEIDDEAFRIHGHGDDVVCLITDIFFPKGNDLNSTAGKDLIRLVRKYYPRIPIITASKTKEADAFKDITFVLPKGDPGSLITLRKHIRDNTGIGEFLIFSKQGEILFQVKNITEMMEVLDQAEKDTKEAKELREILESYGAKDNFSTWLYMHSFRELADELRPKSMFDHRLITVLKRSFKREMLRMECTPLIINGVKIFNLQMLVDLLRSIDPAQIQEYSDNDIFSSWLDRKGYTELADELRPVHGSGEKLAKTLIDIVEKWIRKYSASNQTE